MVEASTIPEVKELDAKAGASLAYKSTAPPQRVADSCSRSAWQLWLHCCSTVIPRCEQRCEPLPAALRLL